MGLLGSLFEKEPPATAQQLLAYAADKTADIGGRDDAVLELLTSPKLKRLFGELREVMRVS